MKPSSDKIFPTTLTGGLLEPVLLPVPLRGDLIHVIVTTDEPDLSCLEKSFRTHPPDVSCQTKMAKNFIVFPEKFQITGLVTEETLFSS